MGVAGRHPGVCGVAVALTAALVVWAVPTVLDTFDRSNLRISPAAVPTPTTAGPRASPAHPRAGGRVAAAERETADRFIAFAKRPTANNLDQIKFAEEVLLGLGPDIIRGTRTLTALADPPAWRLQPESEYFRAAVGPFSAIDTLADAGAVRVTGGPHAHCASPPMPPPDQVAALRRISIQPTGTDSCLEWWTVDLFLTDIGSMAAVTIDVWEP